MSILRSLKTRHTQKTISSLNNFIKPMFSFSIVQVQFVVARFEVEFHRENRSQNIPSQAKTQISEKQPLKRQIESIAQTEHNIIILV